MTLLVKTGLAEEAAEKLISGIKVLIEKSGGKIVKTENSGKKPLAYPIKKQTEADYWFLEISETPEKIKPFEEKLKTNENILRYLIIKKA